MFYKPVLASIIRLHIRSYTYSYPILRLDFLGNKNVYADTLQATGITSILISGLKKYPRRVCFYVYCLFTRLSLAFPYGKKGHAIDSC